MLEAVLIGSASDASGLFFLCLELGFFHWQLELDQAQLNLLRRISIWLTKQEQKGRAKYEYE